MVMILLLGDIHGDYKVLERAIDLAHQTEATAIIQVGDFGLFRDYGMANEIHFHKVLSASKVPVYFIDGNHDVILCETGGEVLGKDNWTYDKNNPPVQHPLFLFGSESHGIPEKVSNAFDRKISIPQRGVMRSFNVSAAMNIICWDYIKEMHL